MNYAKLIGSQPVYAPNIVRFNNTLVINPDAEKLTMLGYKAVTYTEFQFEAPEGYIWSETWTETQNTIIQGWELVPEGDLEAEEALNILMGGDGV